MARPYRKKSDDRLLNPGATKAQIMCDFACAPLDRVAREMDKKWGIDRLPEMVDPALALRYGRAVAALHAAMDAGDADLTAAMALNCCRGLTAMDAAAVAAGRLPMPPEIWDGDLDGVRFCIIRDVADWQSAERLRPGVPVYTMRQVAVALEVQRMALVNEPRAPLPRPVSPIGLAIDDEIPY